MSQTLPERRSTTTSERFEPFSELDQLTERMRRMLEQTFSGFGWSSQLLERTGWSPPVDLEETDDTYVLEADLPGAKPEDIDVQIVGNELSITGEVKESQRTGTVRRQSRRTGRFSYHVALPSHLDPEKVEARLQGGVLKVTVPKSERADRRRIEVTA